MASGPDADKEKGLYAAMRPLRHEESCMARAR
jgi:hypothetical protein